MNILLRWLLTTISVLITAYLLPGVHVDSFYTAVIVALALGILNAFLKPVLILFALPAVLFTLGLFLLVINTLIILLTDKMVDGFEVDGFWWALAFSVVLWAVNAIFTGVKKRAEEKK